MQFHLSAWKENSKKGKVLQLIRDCHQSKFHLKDYSLSYPDYGNDYSGDYRGMQGMI